jgi:hypothetical protein
MDSLQTFLVYAVITVLMAPLLLLYGLPFILLAGAFTRLAKPRFSNGKRLLLSCGIAALGIAPAYDTYRAPLPIYTWLLDDRAPSAGFMLASFAVTWVLVLLPVKLLSRLGAARARLENQ